MDLNNLLSGAIGAIVGGLVGFFTTKWATKRQLEHSRKAEVINFSISFNSPEMQQAEIAAHGLVTREMLKDEWKEVKDDRGFVRREIIFNDATIKSLYEKLEYSELIPLFKIMKFYAHLNIAIENKFVDGKLASKVFGSIFLWWWERCLNGNKQDLDWDIFKHIPKLHDYIKKNISEKEYKDWCATGREYQKQRDEKKPNEN